MAVLLLLALGVYAATPDGVVSWTSANLTSTTNLGYLSATITQTPITGKVGVQVFGTTTYTVKINEGQPSEVVFPDVTPGETTPLQTIPGTTSLHFTYYVDGESAGDGWIGLGNSIDFVYIICPGGGCNSVSTTYAFECVAPNGATFRTQPSPATWVSTNIATVQGYLLWPMPYFNFTVTAILRTYNLSSGVFGPITRESTTPQNFRISSFVNGLSVTTDYQVHLTLSGQFSTMEPYEVFVSKGTGPPISTGMVLAGGATGLSVKLDSGVVGRLAIAVGDNVTVAVKDPFGVFMPFISGAPNWFTYQALWTPSPPYGGVTPTPVGKLKTGVIVGIAVGSAVGVAVIVTIGLVLGLRARRTKSYLSIKEVARTDIH